MKRGLIFFVYFLIFTMYFLNLFPEATGLEITGRALTQQVAMNVTILNAAPYLNRISPENKTYLTNHSLLLNYSSSRAQQIWYSIDNGVNITITSTDYLYFQTSQGSHTLRLYANNTEGTTNTSVTFSTNSSYYTFYYTNWQGSASGNSTNFSRYSSEDLQNLSNMILEHTGIGKILFNQQINLTDDSNPSDGIINIDDYINFSFNRIEIDTEYLLNLNKSATLSISNLSYSNPRIAMNGQVCPSTICTKQSYSGGVLTFNVTHFTSYSAEETPSGGVAGGVTGGGENIFSSPEFNFDVDTDNIKISLKQGESIKKNIMIRNNGNQPLKINLDSSEINEFVDISKKSFKLEVGEAKKIILEFKAEKDAVPDLYIGKIIISEEDITKEIPVTIEVESAKSLFDVSVEIPERYLYASPNKEFIFAMDLINVRRIGLVDVEIEYIIKNENGKDIFSQKETVAVETRTRIERSVLIPRETEYGKYILYAKVNYNGEIASASSWFNIGRRPIEKTTIFIYMLLVILIVMMISVIYEIRKIKEYLKHHKKVDESMLFKRIGRRKNGT